MALSEELALVVDRFKSDKVGAAAVVREIKHVMRHGCGDNSCEFHKPTGLATNGGCRCWNVVESVLYKMRSV